MVDARFGGVYRRVVVAFAVAAVVACGSPPPSGSSLNAPVVAKARDAQFEVLITADRERYAPGQPINIATRLTYGGPQPQIGITHGGAGPILVSLEQLDGPFDPGGGSDASCGGSVLNLGVPVDTAYQKSGGWSGEDPMAGQYRAFFADPLVRLPVGTYRFTAVADFYEGECGGGGAQHDIKASVTIAVTP